MWVVELSPQPFHCPGLIKAKPSFDGQFSREIAVHCAMIAQNAYANGWTTNRRQREGTREPETPGR
jgi:hypothetical protein